MAFDENGNQITRRTTYSEEWVDVPIPEAIELLRKRSIPVDLEMQLRTTGEEVLLVEHVRTIKSIDSFDLDNPLDFNSEPIKIGPWKETINTNWVKTGQSLKVRPVDFRTCPISCGGMP